MFYVYVHFRGNEPFYVGYGTKKRPTSKQRRNKFHLAVWNKAVEEGCFRYEIVFEGTTEECAKLETELIEKYGRRCLGDGPLTNIAPGGTGGCTVTDFNRKSFKEACSERQKKIWKNPGYREKRNANASKGMKERWKDPEYRKRFKESQPSKKGIRWWVNPEGETRQAFEKPDGDWKIGRKWRPIE